MNKGNSDDRMASFLKNSQLMNYILKHKKLNDPRNLV